MTTTRLLRALLLCPLFMLLAQHSWAQTKTISGKVNDEKGHPVAGASILVKGSTSGTSTDVAGTFKLTVPAATKSIIISYVGYVTEEVLIPSTNEVELSLKPEGTVLTDVVVVGYGSVKKKDLTGSVASVKEKDFNKGNFTSPDQLIQGKVAGVQVLNNSGQPGGAATVKIRGNSSIRAGSQPLYVVDGVPLDGRESRPGVSSPGGLGTSPAGNPLNFINPNDIASMDVLKDASATAIYGSRAAYGVIIITTKRGKAGAPKIDFNASAGTSSLLRKLEVLNGDEYRQALKDYGYTAGDYGKSVDAMDAILRNGVTQNYSIALSGGTETGRYRLSAGYFDQQGIILKSDFKKVTTNFSTNFKFLNSKKLGLDINLITSQSREEIPSVSNNSGFEGNIVGQALQWNPTQPLYNDDGSFNILRGSTTINPVAASAAFDDNAKVTTVLGSISPYYKITKDLEYRFLYSINYSTGIRRTSIKSFINMTDVVDRGWANYSNNELTTQQITHTLNYNKQITQNLSLNAVVGYEYMKFENKGVNMNAKDFGSYPVDYTNYFQYTSQASRGVSSFADPTTELQSYFARAIVNWRDIVLLTGTVRRDGSSKFGENNKYGTFPAFAGAWNISNSLLKGFDLITNLRLRAGWGKTGSQDIPAGSAKYKYSFTGPGTIALTNYPNTDLKWQADEQSNVGVDFGLFKNRMTVVADYFIKKTTGLLYPTVTPDPAPPGAPPTWKNLDGQIENKGFEIAVNWNVIKGKDFNWDLGVNSTFQKNNVTGLTAPIQTGALNGQGISGATCEVIANDLPINAFYTKQYEGLDKDGFAMYTDDGYTLYYVGNPNPSTVLGISTTLSFKKLSFTANMNGAYGQDIYNNTLNSVVPIGNLGSRNIAKSLLGLGEAAANPISPSSRYLEKGNYLKMANATLSYSIGNAGKIIKNLNIYVTGQNLFVLTNFSGFDPEVNTDHQVNGVPSVGIEYTPYPSAKTFILGVNFSL